MYPSSEKRFVVINLIAIVALFALILAGGIVRSSGSGMGCPDWPKCFGHYVPPTHASQLPKGYQEKYIAQRVNKNQRFSKVLDVLGYGDLANKILHDKSILVPEEFNAYKTWTEYINRLLGAFTGLVLIGCFLASYIYIKKRTRILVLSLINLLLVIFQGWLGSVVVSTNLLSWLVTLHMLVALGIIAISIYTYFQARMMRDRNLMVSLDAGPIKILAVIVLILSIIQITLGTEVREQIDAVSDSLNQLNRSEWVLKSGHQINWHRDFAILILIANLVLFFMIRMRYSITGFQFKYVAYNMLIIGLQIITGIVLTYLALPPVAQAAHVFLATLLFGCQFYLLLLLKNNRAHLRRSRT